MTRRFALALAAVLLVSRSLPAAAADLMAMPDAEPATSEPMLPDLGSWHRTIATKSPEAQAFFDQGLRLLYGFNLEEAQRSFEEATRRDPACALCFWGVGMALGPHINLPGLPDRTVAARHAVDRAKALVASAPPVEQALVGALDRRFSDPAPTTPEGQAALDQGYADGMREVARRFPDDPDVQAFYAESLMNLRPWHLWTIDGQAAPGTEEIVATLQAVLAKHPEHPGANHYLIHALEASPHPEQALAAADRVARLIPGMAHIVHMPAHIYARVGRWEDAAIANRAAIAVDSTYMKEHPQQGLYLMYYAHNYQFLWWNAMMEGRSREALESARTMVAAVPPEMLQMIPGSDFVLAYPIWTLVRFGRDAEVLAEPRPPAGYPYLEAVWHVARGLALVRLGRLPEARTEATQSAQLAASIPAEAMEGLNSAKTLLGLANDWLGGAIDVASGDREGGLARLRAAAMAEDGLAYNEPPDWYLPPRQALGAELLREERYEEAAAAFRADLERWKGNGWSLAGLAASLRGAGRGDAAAPIARDLAAAWSHADVPPPFGAR